MHHLSPLPPVGRHVIAAAAIGALLVAACGGNAATRTPDAAPSPSAAVSGSAASAAPSGSPSLAVTPSEETSASPIPTDSGSSGSSPSPSASPSAPLVSPAPTHLPVPTGTPGTLTGAHGTIWDRLPAGFPIYPGLEPAPAPGTPASANLAMAGGSAQALVAWYQAALAAEGYTVGAPSAPLEDGSRQITAHRTDRPDCSVELTIGTKGTMTFVTIGYGSACTFD